MQLHACLLFFIITTDKTLALSHRHCGGNVNLDQDPAGHINLTLPELLIDNDSLNTMNLQPHKTPQVSVCSWTIDIPAGTTLHLKPEWFSVGSILTIRCISDEKSQALESGMMAVLSDCDTNKAVLTWTGAEPSSNIVQLAYHVQEDERNSSEDHSTLLPDVSPQAGAGTTSVRATEGGEGQLYEGLDSSSGPRLVSSGSAQDREPLHPTLGRHGLPVTARADRETLPLPEEKANNGADTSGAAHLTDAPLTATEGARPYLQHELESAETSGEIHRSQQTTESSGALFGTNRDKSIQTSKQKDSNTDAGESVSTSSVLCPASSTKELHSQTTRESDATLIPHRGDVIGTDEQHHSWRTTQNTDSFDLNSASATSNPLNSSTKPPNEPTSSLPLSFSQDQRKTHSTVIAELHTPLSATEATSVHPNTSQTDSQVSTVPEVSVQTPAVKLSDELEKTEELQGLASSPESQTIPPQSTEAFTHSPSTAALLTQMNNKETETMTQRSSMTIYPSSDVGTDHARTSAVSPSFSTQRAALMTGSIVQNSETTTETLTLNPIYTLVHSTTYSPTPEPRLSSSTSPSSHTQTQTALPVGSTVILTSSVSDSVTLVGFIDPQTTPETPETPHTVDTHNHQPPVPSVKISNDFDATTALSPLPLTTTEADRRGGGVHVDEGDEFWLHPPSSTTTHSPLTVPPRRLEPQINSSWDDQSGLTSQTLTFTLTWSSTNSPRFYIVPDQPVEIRVESIELLLQIVVEESKSAVTAGLEQDTAAWVQPYLQRAPGFSKLLGVWSSGHAVQSLVGFKTSEALQWLSRSGPTSLLEQTGLAQAVREGTTFRSSKINNITVGGLQSDVCDWLLQCPVGFTCISQSNDANYSCSSVCHFDHCHHHGICTHHPGQLPVCRCLVGEDFWYMGQRCDVRMTRARLVGACLAVLVIIVTVIGVLAFVAVRRYRAILIQAKVDQTRSSYRRFNHFDELSGRFWLRSWAGSADSLDNPAFTRSDELLHLRALDRPCCYHDDTLSLPSTCPSHGTRINTIYPNSSQYGWRGSEMSMGDGVLDSGKASDLSVCSWPVEPIHWTPFPLLQQLAAQRTPTTQVRMSRPRSYCEGMELVEMGRSWTA